MAIGNLHTSIITINISGLNSPAKGTEWQGSKNQTQPCCLQEMHLNCKDKGRLRVKVWKMIVQANSIHRKACVAILISDKTDFKITKVTRDKDGHFTMIKAILHQEDITLLNLHVPNQGT